MISVNEINKTFIPKGNGYFSNPFKYKNVKYIQAVHDVSFECQPGRVVGLIGANGAGKTTTLRMLGGMLKPTSGSISICNIDMANDAQNVKKRIGFLSSNTGLYDRLTTQETVKYFADLNGMESNEFNNMSQKLFTQLSMESMINRRVGTLSTGMKQKVSIVRSVIHNPDVIMFDEPTTGLDIRSSQVIVKLLQEFKQENKTIIFSTHRLNEIKTLCDDIIVLNQGKLSYSGSYENFIKQMKEKTIEEELIKLIGAEND